MAMRLHPARTFIMRLSTLRVACIEKHALLSLGIRRVLGVVGLDELVDGRQVGIVFQHLLVHGGYGLLEGGDVRVEEGDALLVLGRVLGLLHSGFPGVPLGLVEDLEALVKNGPLLLAEAFHKVQVADEDVGDHLVHGVGVILAHVAVAVVCSTPQADSTAKVIKLANKITYKRFIILFLYYKSVGIRAAESPSQYKVDALKRCLILFALNCIDASHTKSATSRS